MEAIPKRCQFFSFLSKGETCGDCTTVVLPNKAGLILETVVWRRRNDDRRQISGGRGAIADRMNRRAGKGLWSIPLARFTFSSVARFFWGIKD